MDFILIDVSAEIYAIEEFLEIMEKQIEHIKKSQKSILDKALKEKKLNSDDHPEWDELYQNYDRLVEFLLPCFFRGPFLISLYAIYEAAVTEIARLLQKDKGQALSINDLRGADFLDRAEKYYMHILHFDLYVDKSAWEQIKMLSEIRNAIAHTNGRIDVLRENAKKRILDWVEKKIGINLYWGSIVVDAAFLEKTFLCVRTSLLNLVERYKDFFYTKKTTRAVSP
jgi:hypothetical protein